MINENDPATLSTSGRLLSYNNAVKDGLQTGLTFTKLMDQLINTKDPEQLVDAAQKLSIFVLDSDYVTFPHQYNHADYYLIFMSRLLELHDEGDRITLQSHEANQHLTQQITALGDLGVFAFQSAQDDNEGVFYRDQVTGETLFYLNLSRKMMRLNSSAITKLFIETYLDKVEPDQLIAATDLFIVFGKSLKEDFGYDVDFNVLDMSNSEFYAFQTSNIDSDIIDKLFVAAAQENYMLKHADEGAILELKPDLSLRIGTNQNANNAGWGLTVHDANQEVSWFKVVLQYPFLRNWYLNNLSELQIRSDGLIF